MELEFLTAIRIYKISYKKSKEFYIVTFELFSLKFSRGISNE